jgi:hypothetical protein
LGTILFLSAFAPGANGASRNPAGAMTRP